MLKGIFFDLGGTLYSYRNLGATSQAIIETLAQELQLDPALVVRENKLATQQADRHYANVPSYLFKDYFAMIFDYLLQRLDRPQLRYHFEWFEEYQRVMLISAMRLKDDCHSTLAALNAKGLYLSVVSNADENMLRPLMSRAALEPFFHHRTSSEAAQSCKPDARFFAVALEKSGLAAEEVLFVGDSLEQDIRGARAANMKTALISEFAGPAPMHIGAASVEPDFRITKLSELLGTVAALC